MCLYGYGLLRCLRSVGSSFLPLRWSQDLPKLSTIYADDAVHEDKTVSANFHGKKAVEDFAQSWFQAFPDLTLTPVSINVAGNRGTAEFIATGTQKGDMPGMPASNK